MGFPGTDERSEMDFRCCFPVGIPFNESLGRAPHITLDFDSAYLLFFAVRVVQYEYDITVTVGGVPTHYTGNGSLGPARIDAVTPAPTEQYFPMCTLFSCIAGDTDFSVMGFNPITYDPLNQTFSGTVFFEGALNGLTTSSLGTVATSVVADMFGAPLTVYAPAGTTATGSFTMEILEYWEYELSDGTICRDALTGELKQDTPPAGV